MKVLSVVGARPQFIKAAPVCRALRAGHDEVLVHTGQHYDASMSDVFFTELGIPAPDEHLGVGSGSQGRQTARMLEGIEAVLEKRAPDVVLVYGDTNSTLAAGLAAAKLGIPVVHVEAGLRSFNRSMPEEINRVLVDHLSTLLLCPTTIAVDNLAAEGITDGVELVGDVMLDTARFYAENLPSEETLTRFGLRDGAYYLATVHRASNADDRERMLAILRAFTRLDRPVIWPIHPRTRKNLAGFGVDPALLSGGRVRTIPPVSYRETMSLLRHAAGLLTDSGGMQKEAYFLRVPCVTLREDTEWVETVEGGWNRLAGADEERIVAAVGAMWRPQDHPDHYGDGHAAAKVVAALEKRFA